MYELCAELGLLALLELLHCLAGWALVLLLCAADG